MNPDNFRVDAIGADLHDSLALAFGKHKTVASFRVDATPDGSPICYLFWNVPEGASPFIAPLGVENTAEVVRTWLKTVEPAKPVYGFDGSVEKGHRVVAETWLSNSDLTTAVCSIQPVWLYYGK